MTVGIAQAPEPALDRNCSGILAPLRAVASDAAPISSVHTTLLRDGPYKSLADVDYATVDWVDWYKNFRLHSSLWHGSAGRARAASLRCPQPRAAAHMTAAGNLSHFTCMRRSILGRKAVAPAKQSAGCPGSPHLHQRVGAASFLTPGEPGRQSGWRGGEGDATTVTARGGRRRSALARLRA